MSRPTYLKKGDKVAVVATAKKLNQGQLNSAIELIEGWGLEVKQGRNLYASSGLFAGSDQQRLNDLQEALDDPEIKAVIFGRGGYGTARLVDALDWTAFINQPKWLCGFSDLTVLLQHVSRNWDIESIHSSMPIFFQDGESNRGSASLKETLFGDRKELSWKGHSLNKNGSVSAPFIGGNLSVLCSIIATPSQVDWKGKILFLEDLNEYLYHLDRMMVQLRRSGQLYELAGVVIGQFTDMMENDVFFGKSAYDIILESLQHTKCPIAFDAPIGHMADNEAVYHGRTIQLTVNAHQSTINF